MNSSLRALDPMGVLKRGYSVCRKLPEEAVVVDSGILNKGDNISLTFAKGGAVSKVLRVEDLRLMI